MLVSYQGSLLSGELDWGVEAFSLWPPNQNKAKMTQIVWTSDAVYPINYFIVWQLIQTSFSAI